PRGACPALQVSAPLHTVLSLHVVPSAAAGLEHIPVVVSHAPATWQASDAVHTTGFAPGTACPSTCTRDSRATVSRHSRTCRACPPPCCPCLAEPAPTPAEPAPTPAEPAPTPAEPAPTPAKPASTPAELAPIPAEPAPTPAKLAPTLAMPAPTP